VHEGVIPGTPLTREGETPLAFSDTPPQFVFSMNKPGDIIEMLKVNMRYAGQQVGVTAIAGLNASSHSCILRSGIWQNSSSNIVII
jgi:hypothetical protein